MPWPDVVELCSYWTAFPPIHVTARIMLEVYTTWKPPMERVKLRNRPPKPFGTTNISQLMSSGFFGKKASPLPDRIRNLIGLAEEVKKKLNKAPDA